MLIPLSIPRALPAWVPRAVGASCPFVVTKVLTFFFYFFLKNISYFITFRNLISLLVAPFLVYFTFVTWSCLLVAHFLVHFTFTAGIVQYLSQDYSFLQDVWTCSTCTEPGMVTVHGDDRCILVWLVYVVMVRWESFVNDDNLASLLPCLETKCLSAKKHSKYYREGER